MVKKSTLLLAAISVLALLVFVQLGCNFDDDGNDAPKVTSTSKTDNTVKEQATNMDTHSMSMEGETMYACPMHPEERSTDPNAKCPKCGMTVKPVDNDNADIFTCPMHPEERSTDPNAKCPKCGMAMEKVDDDAEEGDEHEHEGHDH
ncbi:MAG: heavy metal-binding domain-containing protein [bacterium]